MKREYKISKHNSTVCGYPGREFDWTKFHWDGTAVCISVFMRPEKRKSPEPWVDNSRIVHDCQYLHVPYDWVQHGTIYRVRPNYIMCAGEIYRGHLIKRQTVTKKPDGAWYWVLEFENEKLTPEEANELMYCWIHESQRRYGKVNTEAPLYLKLKAIADTNVT